MIDHNFFKQAVHGIAYPPDVENYYQKLVEYIDTYKDAADIHTAIDQLHYLEENFGFGKQSEPIVSKAKKPEDVKEIINKIIDRDLPPNDLLPVMAYLAPELRWRLTDLLNYYQVQKEQREETEFKEEIEQQMDEVIAISKEDINLADYLPDWLAQPLINYCQNSQVRHSIALLTLLTASSCCHPIGTKINVDGSKGWKQPPNLFSLIVSPTGQGKSPILDALIQEPFAEIQAEWKNSYEFEKALYYQRLEEIKALPKEEKPDAMRELIPLPDRERILFSSDPTIIGLNLQFNAYPQQGILGLYDEASKLFAFDRTASGKSDRADLLSYYNGYGVAELRRDGIRSNVQNTLFSILGAIQPEIVLDLMGNCNDPSGQWARFIFVIQPLQRKLPSRTRQSIDLKELLLGVYKRLLAQNKILYVMSPQACELFDDYLYFEIEPLRITNSSLGMAALYGKTGGKVARLALNLHALEVLKTDRQDIGLIHAETIEKAISLDCFFTNQTKVLYNQATALTGELPAKLALIIERSQQAGPLTAREVKRNILAFRDDDSAQIRSWFKKLEVLGKGQCIGSGSRIKFTAL